MAGHQQLITHPNGDRERDLLARLWQQARGMLPGISPANSPDNSGFLDTGLSVIVSNVQSTSWQSRTAFSRVDKEQAA